MSEGPLWEVTRGTSEPRDFEWNDAGGPVLLSGVQIRVRIVGWEGQVLELLSGRDAQIWIADQVEERGLFTVQLSAEQVALLPVEPPPRYEVAAIIEEIVAPIESGPMKILGAAP